MLYLRDNPAVGLMILVAAIIYVSYIIYIYIYIKYIYIYIFSEYIYPVDTRGRYDVVMWLLLRRDVVPPYHDVITTKKQRCYIAAETTL